MKALQVKQQPGKEKTAPGSSRGRPAVRHNHDAAAILHMQQTAGNRAVQSVLRNSARGQPDASERQADRIAARIVGIPGKRADFAGERAVARAESPVTQDAGPMALPPVVEEVIASPGQALDPATRGFMESSLGHDFQDVRIHRDGRAAISADELGALAYTAGSQVVFARGRYAPQQAPGARLLAHELVHVAQQRGSATAVIQRAPLSGSPTSVSLYELAQTGGAPRQVRTSRTSGGTPLDLAYDPATRIFTVTFRMAWIHPHDWADARRTGHVTEFQNSIRRVWNNRFALLETQAPRRAANVEIGFDNYVVPRMQSAAHEQAQLTLPPARGRWIMDVRQGAGRFFRESVNRGSGAVELSERSIRQLRRKAAELRRGVPYAYSGTGGNRTFVQAPAPHEFGHMIGLGDEYLEDVAGEGVPAAARGHINDRIMNVGENVTADVYAPFAEWLSGLTASTWKVGKRIR